jgi:hypothetical protein
VDFNTAIEQHVKSRLEASFGKAVAMLIVASASNKVNAPMVGMSKDQYLSLCTVICEDQRVVDMWGTSGATDALLSWQQLV